MYVSSFLLDKILLFGLEKSWRPPQMGEEFGRENMWQLQENHPRACFASYTVGHLNLRKQSEINAPDLSGMVNVSNIKLKSKESKQV